MTAEMYTTSSCSFCKQAKEYLRKLGINVNEKDITKDQRYFEEFKRHVGENSGVPVIFLKGTKITGFDRKKIDSILGI
jgi:glutaredoxin